VLKLHNIWWIFVLIHLCNIFTYCDTYVQNLSTAFWSITYYITALTFDLCNFIGSTRDSAVTVTYFERTGKADERMFRKSRLVCVLSCRNASCGLSSTRHDALCAQQNSLPLSRDGRSEKKRNHEYALDEPRVRPFIVGVSHPAVRGPESPEDRRGHPFSTVWPTINSIAITGAYAPSSLTCLTI